MSISTCDEETFSMYKKAWTQRLQAIKLPDDINPNIGQHILSNLDEAYGILRIDLAEIESAKDKTEAIIRQNERSKSIGTNEDARKRSATEYLGNYPIGENETIDMYEPNRLISYRHSIVKSFVDIINNKQQRLITMSGFLKLEKDLLPGSQG